MNTILTDDERPKLPPCEWFDTYEGPQDGFTERDMEAYADAREAAVLATPAKLPIPPAGADALDVVYAEGWNAACDSFFGGKPAPEPVILTVETPIPPEWREAVKVAREALIAAEQDSADFQRVNVDEIRAALAQLDSLGGGE